MGPETIAAVRYSRAWLVATALLGMITGADAQQCCLPDVGDSPEAALLIEGIYSGTLVLGATPFLLVTGIALWMHRRWRSDGV